MNVERRERATRRVLAPHRGAGLLLAIAAALGACRLPPVNEQPAEVTLVTDSAEYTVRFARGFYRATIGYVYTNQSGDAVSTDECPVPWPALEKKANGRWVRAYNPLRPHCRSIRPFRIPDGGTYRDSLDLAVAPRGRHATPTLEVDSINGIYRLRWTLRAGYNPGRRRVVAISNEFRLNESDTSSITR